MTRDEMEIIINNRLNEFTLQLSEHLAETVQGAVRLTVNGKIDALDKKIQPMADFYHSLESTNKVLVWLLKGVILIGSATSVLYWFIKYLKS